jgi:hypothetical protein
MPTLTISAEAAAALRAISCYPTSRFKVKMTPKGDGTYYWEPNDENLEYIHDHLYWGFDGTISNLIVYLCMMEMELIMDEHCVVDDPRILAPHYKVHERLEELNRKPVRRSGNQESQLVDSPVDPALPDLNTTERALAELETVLERREYRGGVPCGAV